MRRTQNELYVSNVIFFTLPRRAVKASRPFTGLTNFRFIGGFGKF